MDNPVEKWTTPPNKRGVHQDLTDCQEEIFGKIVATVESGFQAPPFLIPRGQLVDNLRKSAWITGDNSYPGVESGRRLANLEIVDIMGILAGYPVDKEWLRGG